METDVVEEIITFEDPLADDREKIPETFAGHEALPSVSLN